MIFKTIRHKKEKESFAHILGDGVLSGALGTSSTPWLLQLGATMEGIAKMLPDKEDKQYFLDEYEMVMVSITVYALP